MFWYRDTATPGVDWGFTDTLGGASSGDCATFNLARHVGDDPAAVDENRARLATELGSPVVFMNQVHGKTVEEVERPWTAEPPACDALVTTARSITLAVMVADCTPVLLADPEAGVIAAVHAGRPGLVSGVVPAAVSTMRRRGARAIAALVGPSVCPRCYEVPEAMRAEVAAVAPAAFSVSLTGTPAVDVAAGVVEQLHGLDVPVSWVPGCTREEPRLFSYRRSRTAGRFAGFVRLTGPA